MVITFAIGTQNCTANDAKILAQSRPIVRSDTLLDPLFAIEYRPSEIHFQNPPDDVYKCKDLKMRRGNIFLFGQTSKGNVHYYYVSGWMEYIPDTPHPTGARHFEADTYGGVIAIVSPDDCRSTGADTAWSYDNEQIRQITEQLGFTKDIVYALLADTVDREVQAFGGKEAFLRRLAATGIDVSKLGKPIEDSIKTLRETKTK